MKKRCIIVLIGMLSALTNADQVLKTSVVNDAAYPILITDNYGSHAYAIRNGQTINVSFSVRPQNVLAVSFDIWTKSEKDGQLYRTYHVFSKKTVLPALLSVMHIDQIAHDIISSPEFQAQLITTQLKE